jgi:hypothetical protein
MQALTLSDPEITAAGRVAPLVAMSPRRVKRFLNTYLVVRARIFSELGVDTLDNESIETSDAVLTLVGLLIGAPNLAEQLPTVSGEQTRTLGEWIDDLPDPVAKSPMFGEMLRVRSFRERSPELNDLPMNSIVRWNAIASRFILRQPATDADGARDQDPELTHLP